MMPSAGTETDLNPGDRCYLVRDPSCVGTVTQAEGNRLSVMVRWDDCDGEDFQWATKIAKIAKGTQCAGQQ